MPKIVDHESQRQRFVAAAMRLIASSGLEGVTMRAVAAEAGLSYGSLFHYFDSKDALLIHAVRHLLSQQTRRLNDLESKHCGLRALEELLCDDAITTDASRDTSLVWMTFQYQAALREPFADINEKLVAGWRGRMKALLREAQAMGEVPASLDVDVEAEALWAYSTGIGQLGVLHPETYSPERQKALIGAYMDKLRGDTHT